MHTLATHAKRYIDINFVISSLIRQKSRNNCSLVVLCAIEMLCCTVLCYTSCFVLWLWHFIFTYRLFRTPPTIYSHGQNLEGTCEKEFITLFGDLSGQIATTIVSSHYSVIISTFTLLIQ